MVFTYLGIYAYTYVYMHIMLQQLMEKRLEFIREQEWVYWMAKGRKGNRNGVVVL